MFNELPKELKELNLTPAQILERLKKGEDAEKKTTELEAKFTESETARVTLNNEFEATKTRLSLLEASAHKKDERKDDPPKKTDFLDDGDKAFDERFAERIGPTLTLAFNSAKAAARMSAKNSLFGKRMETASGTISLSNLWDRWIGDIDKAADEMMKSNAASLQYEQTWVNLFNFVKGNHMEELLAKPTDFVEPVHSNVDRRVGDAPPADKLTDEESEIAAKQARYGKGITNEKILETKKKLKFVNA